MIMNGKTLMLEKIDKKSGVFRQEVSNLAFHYIQIAIETNNTWKGFMKDCIDLAEKEIGEKYGTKNMEDGNKS